MSSSGLIPVVTTFDKERQVLRAEVTVKDYKKITEKSTNSEVFSHPSAPPSWQLQILLNAEMLGKPVSIYLYEETFKQPYATMAKFSFGYEDKRGEEFLRQVKRLDNIFDNGWGFGHPSFLTTEHLNNVVVKADGSLKLFVEIDYATLQWGPKKQFSRSKVGGDLSLALEGKFSDVVFNVGKRSLKAHKVIIAYRSKYFGAMFDSDSAEALSGVIEITDFEYAVVRGLLEFIYNGAIHLTNVVFASSLRIAADKYEVLDLSEICEDYIVSSVDKKTAAKAILSTSLVGSNRIRKACLEVFKKRVNYKDIDNFGDVFEDPILREYVIDGI